MASKQSSGRWLSSEQLCQRFGVSRFTLRRWWSEDGSDFPKPIFKNRRHYYSEIEIFRWEMKQAGLDPDAPRSLNGLPAVSGVITDYEEFVQAMAQQRSAMKLSLIELDALSGMQEGYASKLEGYGRPYGRGMGPETFPLWLGALRVGIVLVALPRRPRSFVKRVEASRTLDADAAACRS